jgi:hypothetical protein
MFSGLVVVKTHDFGWRLMVSWLGGRRLRAVTALGPTGGGDCTNTQGSRHLSGLIFWAFLWSFGPSVGMFQRGGYSPKAHDVSFTCESVLFLGRMEGVYTASA